MASPAVGPTKRPAQVLGLDVKRLEDVRPRRLDRDRVTAVAGWYVATAITDCPALDAIYRDASLPEVREDFDSWAFCERSGLLYASRRDQNAGLPGIAVSIVVGVVMPSELEMIGADATEVVVIGRFVPSGDECQALAGCRELVVDHVAWTPGA